MTVPQPVQAKPEHVGARDPVLWGALLLAFATRGALVAA